MDLPEATLTNLSELHEVHQIDFLCALPRLMPHLHLVQWEYPEYAHLAQLPLLDTSLIEGFKPIPEPRFQCLSSEKCVSTPS